MKDILVAILAKDKAYCMDFYLRCLLNQTFDKKRIHLYIRTNDNRDNTEEILTDFIWEHGHKYASVVMDSTPISDTLKSYDEHEWNSDRFSILGAIRQESVDYARQIGAHYFVVDCDNFITPDTLEQMYSDRQLGVVGPMLRLSPEHGYASYHNKACEQGYFHENNEYHYILHGMVKGKIAVDTVHCTYFIDNELLSQITYNDGSGRYEYAIFSDNLRQKGIPQYIDNTRFYGFLFLSDQIPMDFMDYIDRYWPEAYHWMKENLE